jgi:hypothetical protein
MVSAQNESAAKNEVPTPEPNGTLSFEFPELPDTLATMLTGERRLPRFTATLPENYSPDGKFPLFVFLLPYGRGELHAPTREVIGARDFICVHLPVFKRTYDKSGHDRAGSRSGSSGESDPFSATAHVSAWSPFQRTVEQFNAKRETYNVHFQIIDFSKTLNSSRASSHDLSIINAM